MNQESSILPRVSRADEEQYLADTLELVRRNTDMYSEQTAKMQADIDEMLEHYHDNDVESLTELNNTVTLHEYMKRTLEKNRRALSKPYFGRIIFRDETLKKQESLYIGRGGISRDTIHPVVVDWRAPVANAYYESNLGQCSYTAPGGEEMPIDLQLKRTFEIEDGTLKEYFDSEVIANDELLTKYLAKNKQAILGEIVATIQKEQNEIIRLTPYRNLIVQGVAGSGKTTVAMHRISYILYNYAERFQPNDFYIVGSNRILLNYITGVLPELDVTGVRQMTMEQLFTRLLYEEWDEKKYRICPIRADARGTLPWFEDLKAFCDRLEWDYLPRKDVWLEPSETAAAPRGLGRTSAEDRVLLLSRETIENYIRSNPSLSIQAKISGLNERLTSRLHNHFLEHIGKYTKDEQKELLRSVRGWFGGKKMKLSIFRLYDDFLAGQRRNGFRVRFPAEAFTGGRDSQNSGGRVTEFDLYDLAALAYLYARVQEEEVISEAHHIVIDEAQDFGMMAYAVLDHCIRGCTYTIMGDVSQNIRFGSGLNDWEELKRLLLRDPADSFRVLKKSYRNTVEISEYALRILRHGRFSVYPVEPIIRHGSPVTETAAEPDQLYQQAAKILTGWQKQGYGTIAVICRDAAGASLAARKLSGSVPVIDGNLEETVFSEGIMVLPVEYTKGLEFDAVLILNPTGNDYPVDDGHAKLLYVAATRALHELCVLHCGSLTGLITEAPADSASLYRDEEVRKTAAFQKNTAVRPTSLFFTSGKSIQMPDQYDAKTILKKAKEPVPSGPAPRPQKNASPVRVSSVPPARPRFGETPSPDTLRPPGHSRIDLSVRWVLRQPDGLCVQSRYGILRLSPVTGRIIRVSFAKLGGLSAAVHSGIAVNQVDRQWMYREIGGCVELLTDELCLRVDKASGAVCYMTRDRKPLVAEQPKDCRRLEAANDVSLSAWLYLSWSRNEILTASGLSLRGRAYVISPDDPAFPFPLICSDRGYGLLIASSGTVISCDMPEYGSYIHTARCSQMDFYFLLGDQEEIRKEYQYLCGV